MKIIIPNPPDRALVFLRRAGYSEYLDPNTQKYSFSKRLGPDFFPKFHIYVEEYDTELVINLHLDQKKTSYEGSRQHSGEYEGPLLDREAERLKNFAATYDRELPDIEKPK
ncbi:MAG: hypothetical protein V1821_04435, partial [bacterium]